jgi:hypothetical protein
MITDWIRITSVFCISGPAMRATRFTGELRKRSRMPRS